MQTVYYLLRERKINLNRALARWMQKVGAKVEKHFLPHFHFDPDIFTLLFYVISLSAWVFLGILTICDYDELKMNLNGPAKPCSGKFHSDCSEYLFVSGAVWRIKNKVSFLSEIFTYTEAGSPHIKSVLGWISENNILRVHPRMTSTENFKTPPDPYSTPLHVSYNFSSLCLHRPFWSIFLNRDVICKWTLGAYPLTTVINN